MSCWELNCMDRGLFSTCWIQLRFVLIVYMYVILPHKQHMPFQKWYSFVYNFLDIYSKLGNNSFLIQRISYSLFHISTRVWETQKWLQQASVLLMKNSVNHAHIDKYCFPKLMDSLMNMKYKSIPLIRIRGISCLVNSELSNCCLTPIQHFVKLYHGKNKLTINWNF
jgi:hypothetical protein